MIPKTIHFCWFGHSSKPELMKKCIRSWKKICPDYEIIEWNEDSFDVQGHRYLRFCYENKKWAFLSDMARLLIVYEHGGIYFDTDVELIRSPEELLSNRAFFGFENAATVATGLGFGAEAGNEAVKRMLEPYLLFDYHPNYEITLTGCPILNTKALIELGMKADGSRQSLEEAEIYSTDFFNPFDDPTGVLTVTPNTYSIHWYGKSWLPKRKIIRSRITRVFHRWFGKGCFERFKKKDDSDEENSCFFS